ncbi:MAG: cytidylate kinase-like family protein [Prevotella sp.]|jgi:cytidylate kinase|nr:cytidylate kinase-like family protein [Prevotella sp.]MBR3080849.1 cytidylate kinase-like family protein [Prevotella sp.]
MDKDQKFVITINRELGSGGRTIGRKLAEKMNVAFYDKALINELKKKFQLDTEQIEKLKSGKSDWWRDFINSAMFMGQGMNEMWYYQRMTGQEAYLVTSSDMFKVEKEILLNVASEASCIIAGRSGFSVFADHPNHLSIFIQAPLEHRIQRIMGKQNLTHEEAEKIIKKVDEMRESYVKKYTGTSRYDTRNYDLVINMEGKSEDDAVELILDYIG